MKFRIAPVVYSIFTCLIATNVDGQVVKSKEEDPRVGTRVMVTVAGAELRTPGKIVWKAYLGQTFDVAMTNGEWLWIADKKGWLWDQNVIAFEGATDELTKRIANRPTAENYHLRGIAFAAAGQYDLAIQDYTASLKQKPEDAGVLNNRGQAHYYAGDYKNAVVDFDAAIKLDPKHFVALNNRALCRIAAKEWDTALGDLNRAIQANAEYPEALNNRGVVHSQKGNYKAAITDLTAAVKIDANYTRAYENRSFAYQRLGQIEDAITDLHTAIEKNPKNHKPVNDLAWIYATTSRDIYRRPDDAVKLAEKACEMTDYSDPNTIDTLATAHAAGGNFEEAQKWIREAIEKAGDNASENLKSHQKLFEAQQVVVQ